MKECRLFSKAPDVESTPSGIFFTGDSRWVPIKLKFIFRKVCSAQNIFITLALLCLIILFRSLVDPGFLTAMCIFTGIFLIPVFSRELRQDKSILLGYWFVVFLHQIIAFTNYYIITTVGAGSDAKDFQTRIEMFSKAGEWKIAIGAELYVQVLGIIYRWFGSSSLLGGQLSILAFAISCIFLMKIIRLCGIERYKLYSLLAFGSLPTMVFLGSITLRESFQVLFFMVAVYFGMKMHFKDGLNSYLIALVASVFAMGSLHRGLVGYAMFIIPLFFVWNLYPSRHPGHVKVLRLAAFIAVPVTVVGLLVFSKRLGFPDYSELISHKFLEKLSNIRMGPINTPGRATYGVALDLSSTIMTFYTGLKIYVSYLFAPFPWQIHNFQDAYAALESAIRMMLIYFSVKHWMNAVGAQKRLLGLMLILYFSISALFAIGTTNYGTAMRHHMLGWWIIAIVGVPPLMAKLSDIMSGLGKFRRKQLLKSF
jgi:hypothetical protein